MEADSCSDSVGDDEGASDDTADWLDNAVE